MYADATSEMRMVDPLRREHHVTPGCAVENLTLGLGARGYRARPRPLVSVLGVALLLVGAQSVAGLTWWSVATALLAIVAHAIGRAAQYSGPGRTNSDYA